MLTFAVNGGTQRPLGGPGFTLPVMTGRMTNQRGFIGRMPFTMASEMRMEACPSASIKGTNVLIHFDSVDGSGNFIDSSGHAITTTGATLSTSAPKFGAGCASMASGDAAASCVMSATDILASSWTIEAWVKATGSNHGWIRAQESNHAAVLVGSLGNPGFLDSSANFIGSLSFGTYPANTWSHRAIVRNGTTITTYADGMAVASKSVDIAELLYHGAGDNLITVGNSFDGFIDEFRFINGRAMYTANFTPPTAPFS